MIPTKDLKKRDLYLNKLIAFQDTEPVNSGHRTCKGNYRYPTLREV